MSLKPSEAFSNPKVEAVRRVLQRYQPFIVTVAAVALIALLLPGRSERAAEEASGLSSGGSASELATGGAGTEAAGSRASSAAASQAASTINRAQTKVLSFAEAKKQGVELVANCDTKTGKIMIPSRVAPPCTQKFVAPNGGATWQGVTGDKIKIVYFIAAENPAAQAILASADADDSEEEVRQQVQEWVQLYTAHFNMWGRKIDLQFVKSTAPSSSPDDDRAARADAIKVIGMKPFAVVNSPANIFVDEVVAKKILCMCTVSLPIETYMRWYPYVWTTLMASTQGYIHRAEYVGERLKGKKAQWAWDDVDGPLGQQFTKQNRKFGFIYYETDDKAYAAGARFFVKLMKEKYGITFCGDCVTEYHGFPRVERTQEEAPGIIQRMKAAGVTSIIFSGDPFGPIFFTKEARQQLYGPEWIITGSALTDTSFFAGLYQQDEWSHAFGISYLAARLAEQYSNDYRLLRWQFNKEPTARAGYAVIDAPMAILFRGLHMAGSVLNPTTFAAGLQNLGVQCRGCITGIAFSFGDHGLWQWKVDPAAADDATEIWWDRNARGENEIGQDQQGLYRYVDGGKRYLPGEWPRTNPKAFIEAGTVTIYDKPPPQDAWPCYPSPATHKMDRC